MVVLASEIGVDNLIIKIEWSSWTGSLYTWHWNASGQRSIIGPYGASNGSETSSDVPNIRLNGVLSLSNTSFGRIKMAFI